VAAPTNYKVLIAPKTVVLILALLLLLWLLYQSQQALVLVFVAYLIACSLYPAVRWLECRNLPRGWSILIFYLIFLALATGVTYLMFGLLSDQGGSFLKALPTYVDRLTDFARHLPVLRDQPKLLTSLTTNTQMLTQQVYQLLLSTFDYLFLVFQGFLSIISVSVLVFLMILQPRQIESALVSLFPPSARPAATEFFRLVSERLGLFIRGQLLVALAVGLMVALGLWLMGVPYALVLGVLAFALDLLPIVGSLLASAFGVLVALGQDPMLAVWTLLLYLVANQLEANFLSPWILGHSVGLGTFWVILSLLFGGTLYGLAGVFLAIPVAILIKLFLQSFYEKMVLGLSPPGSAPALEQTA
jgi:predicted PurR-regulated permease PerM